MKVLKWLVIIIGIIIANVVIVMGLNLNQTSSILFGMMIGYIGATLGLIWTEE
jgi:hypothetical protein